MAARKRNPATPSNTAAPPTTSITAGGKKVMELLTTVLSSGAQFAQVHNALAASGEDPVAVVAQLEGAGLAFRSGTALMASRDVDGNFVYITGAAPAQAPAAVAAPSPPPAAPPPAVQVAPVATPAPASPPAAEPPPPWEAETVEAGVLSALGRLEEKLEEVVDVLRQVLDALGEKTAASPSAPTWPPPGMASMQVPQPVAPPPPAPPQLPWSGSPPPMQQMGPPMQQPMQMAPPMQMQQPMPQQPWGQQQQWQPQQPSPGMPPIPASLPGQWGGHS